MTAQMNAPAPDQPAAPGQMQQGGAPTRPAPQPQQQGSTPQPRRFSDWAML